MFGAQITDETSHNGEYLNEAEITLRRKRLRANQITSPRKKLEDEKVRPFPPFSLSYIDHGHPVLMRVLFLYTRRRRSTVYLRRKSGARNKRNPLASVEDRTPAIHMGNGTPAEGEVDEEENGETAAAAVSAAAAVAAAGAAGRVVEVIPTRYHWISTLRPSPDAPPGDKMFLFFSVPESLLPDQSVAPVAEGDVKMETTEEQEQEHKPRAMVPAVCVVDGCMAKWKYRLVRD